MTLKNSAKFGPKLNPAFQISPEKIGQFVSSRQIGSKFQILLLSFVWKVSDTEGLWNVGGENWMLLSKSATPKLANFFGAC